MCVGFTSRTREIAATWSGPGYGARVDEREDPADLLQAAVGDLLAQGPMLLADLFGLSSWIRG